jgi:hypothetical protein
MKVSIKKQDLIKLFGATNQMTEFDLNRVEEKYSIDLGRNKNIRKKDNVYYPQFESLVRNEANEMSRNYEIFYCLEKTIRKMITDKMDSIVGKDWWDKKVPQNIKDWVKGRVKEETDSGVTIRSEEPIDYTTFGELATIINSNWDVFGDVFNSQRAVEKVLKSLNTLRSPIAHCCRLAEDEEMRLMLTVRDWFRLME